jgi:hypothetical protein
MGPEESFTDSPEFRALNDRNRGEYQALPGQKRPMAPME